MTAFTPWRTSSRSANSGNGDCVQARWRKSSRSDGTGNGNCVETRAHCGAFDVRDSKLGNGSPVFTVDASAFQALLRTARHRT